MGMDQDARLILGGLKNLSPESRRQAVEIARTNKPAILEELKNRAETYGACCPDWWRGCLACSEFRARSLCFCRKLHWWRPWPHVETGELPVVIFGHGGHVRHWYPEAGVTRLVGRLQCFNLQLAPSAN